MRKKKKKMKKTKIKLKLKQMGEKLKKNKYRKQK